MNDLVHPSDSAQNVQQKFAALWPAACRWLTIGAVSSVPCDIESRTGQKQSCLLHTLQLDTRTISIALPPSRSLLTLRFEKIRCVEINNVGNPPVADSGVTHPVTVASYTLHYFDDHIRRGILVDHTNANGDLFLCESANGSGSAVRPVFIPREVIKRFEVDSAPSALVTEEERGAKPDSAPPLGTSAPTRIEPVSDPAMLLQALDGQRAMPVIRIGQALTALGYIQEDQLQQALEQQKNMSGTPLGEILLKNGYITPEQLRTALTYKMGYPIVDIEAFPIDVNALRKVPLNLARKLLILPLLHQQKTLIFATENPLLHSVTDELEFTTQCKPIATLSSVKLDGNIIRQLYAKYGFDEGGKIAESDNDQPSTEQLLQTLEQEAAEDESNLPEVEQSDNQLVRLINSIIIDAYQSGASDIHIETHPGKRKVRIRLRKDGIMRLHSELPPNYRNALVARIKIMAELDISERRKPQDGKIDFGKFSSQHRIELRVATIPTYGGAEDVVMRILSSAKPIPLDQLGLTPENYRSLIDAVERPHGIVLCVGPTGSGKTTTLHSVLQYLNTPDKKIWTAEDPIEIANPDLRQIQVNPKIDWTFERALRALLRADPDIIMVGEIRDTETAKMAIEASLTGHLVLSTLHTNSAPETVVRLLDMGIDPFNFADALAAVLAQRLVRRLCPRCKQQREGNDDEFINELIDDYLYDFPETCRPQPHDLRRIWEQQFADGSGGWTFFRPVGCQHCDQTGYKGRLGIHELLSVDANLRRLIQTKSPPEHIRQAAFAHGHFRTLRQDGILKVLQGLTTIDEIRASTAH